jgi:hypothetical protein
MKDIPISCFIDAAKSTLGGVLAFLFGLFWAAVILYSENIPDTMDATWLCLAWMALIPYTIAKLWGLLLAPILAVLFFGLIWKGWNRFLGASLVAILLSSTTLLCSKHDPFQQEERLPFLVTMGSAVAVCILAIIWEWLKTKPYLAVKLCKRKQDRDSTNE